MLERGAHQSFRAAHPDVTSAPVLKCPDPEKQYFLEVDTSAFALGGVLFQHREDRRRQDVGYFSKALMLPE